MNILGMPAEQLIQLGLTKAAIALSTTLYFKSTLYEQRAGVIACIEDYLALCEPELRWYSDLEIRRFPAATAELLRRPIARLADPALAHKDVKFAAQGGAEPGAPSPYVLDLWNRVTPESLSYLRFSLPLDRLPDFAAFAALTRTFAERLRFHHGYGGLTVNESLLLSVQQSNSRYIFALTKRLLGLEVEDSASTGRAARDAIKGVNWLTLVSDAFLPRLGGEEALRARLGPEVTVSRLPAGLLLQAGPEPRYGDVNAEEMLPEYRAVARALKPIRLFKHPPLGPEELGSFGWQGTADWLRRFDD